MNTSTQRKALSAIICIWAIVSAVGQSRETSGAEGVAPRRALLRVEAPASDAVAGANLRAIAAFFRVELESSTRFVLVESEAEADLVLSLSAVRSGGLWTLDLAVVLRDGTQGSPYKASISELGVGQAEAFLKKTA
ncbi:MAG TPA: hypothetical protein PLC54_04030, partial [Spirochaetales bacterium]|nr:hypothetical protein [Spirochaetales bacterium]